MRRALVAAALAVSFVLTGCSSTPTTQSSDTSFVAGDGSVVLLDAADRRPAPQFSGTTLDGQSVSSGDLAGKVVVLNVWASWCAPCRAEAPGLQRTWLQFQNDDVAFLGLNTRDTKAAADAFVAKFGITYPSLVDTDGAIQLGFRDTLPPQAIPSTLVIDRQGRVAARFLGEVDEASLESVITPLLDEQP